MNRVMVYQSQFDRHAWVMWHPNCFKPNALGRLPTQPEALAAALAHIRTHHQPEETPVSDDCPCTRCDPGLDIGGFITRSRMPSCPTCGNKRCPKGTDHDLTCTGSNEPGQAGSDYA